MVSMKQQKQWLWLVVVVLVILLVITLGVNSYYAIIMQKQTSRSNSSEEMKDTNKVCMRQKEYDALVTQHQQNQRPTPRRADERDRLVLSDPLYPALNRSETRVHDGVTEQIARKNLYNTTQEFNDRYRLIGYVTNQGETKDSGGNVWKLMARESSKNQGEFYMIPANTNYDMKIMLNNDILTGDKLRDIYTIPKTLSFKSPLLNDTPYEVIELPMNDFTNSYN